MLDQAPDQETLRKAFEALLDIPNIVIEKVEINRHEQYMVTVKSTEEGTRCHRCGRHIDKSYGHDQPIVLRHLPILGREVYIKLRPARYQCRFCEGNPTTTQRLSWYEPRSPHTKAYERHILLACVNSTVWDVSMKEAIGYEAVMGIIERNVVKETDWESIEQLDLIGVDEISLKKGHRDFVTIVTGRVEGEVRVLGVLKDRLKATVKEFFSSIPKRLRKQVRAVCSDMYEGFIQAAKEVFGKKVRIVVDRFHVAKLYRDSLDTLRQQEMKRLRRELPEAQYKEFKGVMWVLRKREEDVTKEDRKVLDKLFHYSPKLKQAYNFSNELTAIFDEKLSKRHGTQKINGWIKRVQRSGLGCFDTFIKTMQRHKGEISNYFVDRHTNGFVEGLNNKIKLMKRRCYGILNIGHLFQRLHLDLVGYSLYA